jgi:hypothetical protein
MLKFLPGSPISLLLTSWTGFQLLSSKFSWTIDLFELSTQQLLTDRLAPTIRSQSCITTDGQSVSLSWCHSPIWDPWAIFVRSENIKLYYYTIIQYILLSDASTFLQITHTESTCFHACSHAAIADRSENTKIYSSTYSIFSATAFIAMSGCHGSSSGCSSDRYSHVFRYCISKF